MATTFLIAVSAEVAAKLRPGDYGENFSIVLQDSGNVAAVKAIVTAVNTATNIVSATPVSAAGVELTIPTHAAFTCDFKHVNTKQEQAQNIADAALGLKNKAMRVIAPQTVKVTNPDGTKTNLPSWAAAVVFAATRSSLPPHQGMTNYPLPVISGLEFSNEYFEKDQLDLMSESGVCVLVQDSESAPVYCRHQRTTDISTFDTSEISVVETVDEVSMEVESMIKPLIGVYNITDELLEIIETKLKDYIFIQKARKYPKCGSKILGGQILEIRAQLHGENLDVPKGRVLIHLKLEIGRPFNWATVTITV